MKMESEVKKRIFSSIKKSLKSLINMAPTILGVVMLISIATVLIPKSWYSVFFNNSWLDPVKGSVVGSILAGNPVTSYVLGGEFLKQGISLVTITAFMVSWVTVGLVQFPAEAILLGKKFAISRNVTAFIFSIIVAFITVWGLSLI